MKKKGVLSIMMAVAMTANLAGRGSSGIDAGSGELMKTVEVSSEKEETSSGAEKAVSTETKSDKAVSDITIAYVPTTVNNPFWTAMMRGIKGAMTDKGMDPGRQLVTVDAESDQVTMNNYIYDLINQEMNTIAMAPMDCTTCIEALLAYADANIPVVNMDTAVERTDLVVSVITSNNYTAGVECTRDMMEKLEEGPETYIMNQPSGTVRVQREQEFGDTIGDYSNVIGTSDTSGDIATTLPVTEDTITADNRLADFFCINDMATLGCVQACTASNKPDIVVYGVDGNPDFTSYMANDSAAGSAARQPSVVGASTVDVALSYLAGETVESEIIVPVELITAGNIDDFDVSDWQ